MSTWAEHELACHVCGAAMRARVARGANAARVPAIREDVLARRFHRFTCACGATTQVQTAFEYGDLDRGHLLLVAPPRALAEWESWEARLLATEHRVRELGSPLVEAIVDRVQARVVFGLDELREKLVLWQVALDDALIECVKVRALAHMPALAARGSRLLVDAVNADDGLDCLWFAEAGALTPARRLELPAAWVHEAARDAASLRARLPELFRGGFVSLDRMRSHSAS